MSSFPMSSSMSSSARRRFYFNMILFQHEEAMTDEHRKTRTQALTPGHERTRPGPENIPSEWPPLPPAIISVAAMKSIPVVFYRHNFDVRFPKIVGCVLRMAGCVLLGGWGWVDARSVRRRYASSRYEYCTVAGGAGGRTFGETVLSRSGITS